MIRPSWYTRDGDFSFHFLYVYLFLDALMEPINPPALVNFVATRAKIPRLCSILRLDFSLLQLILETVGNFGARSFYTPSVKC